MSDEFWCIVYRWIDGRLWTHRNILSGHSPLALFVNFKAVITICSCFSTYAAANLTGEMENVDLTSSI